MSLLVLVVAGVAVFAVCLPSFNRTTTAGAVARSSPSPSYAPYIDDGGISQFIDLASLGVKVFRNGYELPTVSADAAQRIALATPSAAALLPATPGYHLVVNTVTPIELASAAWPKPCTCWIVTVFVDPQPLLALACVASNPSIGTADAVVIIDAVSGRVLRDAVGGGLPWVVGQGCLPDPRQRRSQ